jgi:hypothetical protein
MPGTTAAALAAQALVMGLLFTLVLDQYAHARVEQQGGVNVWGYRGPVMPVRQPHEFRLAIAGGDYAFGWGVAPGQTTAAYLRTVVQGRMPRSGEARPVTAVNLGALGLPAREYASRLAQFANLAPDVICLYVDLADSRSGSVMPPFDSGVAHLTGYVPMLPLVLAEKGLPVVGAVGRALAAGDRWLYAAIGPAAVETEDRLVSVGRAVHVALGLAPVVVVLPVPLNSAEQAEHDGLVEVIRSRAAAEPRLRLVDLATEPRLADPSLRLDGFNLGANGQFMVASAVARGIEDLIPTEAAER